MEMRITGGNARGILLSVPQGVEYLRPATDFLREAIFSSLGQNVRNAFVLDLFAGVGSYGLEALSRGADACVFVENNRSAAEAIGDNAKRVKKASARNFTAKIMCQDVFSWAESSQRMICDSENFRKFDIIFIDPPYNIVEERGCELLEIFSKFLSDSDRSRMIIEVPGSHSIGVLEKSPQLVALKRLGRMSNSRQPNALIYGIN